MYVWVCVREKDRERVHVSEGGCVYVCIRDYALGNLKLEFNLFNKVTGMIIYKLPC